MSVILSESHFGAHIYIMSPMLTLNKKNNRTQLNHTRFFSHFLGA